jgi:aminopeptidase
MGYTPPKKILERYADVLVNFALGHGKGIKKDEVVHVVISEYAKPLLLEIQKKILEARSHLILEYLPNGFNRQTHVNRIFYEKATEEQLNFYPKKFYEGLFQEIDHMLIIISDTDPQGLQGIDPGKILVRQKSMRPYLEHRMEKTTRGEMSWTLALYPTEKQAEEANMSEKEFWNQVIKGCFLDEKNPVLKWRQISAKLENVRKKLTDLKIDRVHVEGPDVNLWVKIGEKRRWMTGNGENIPSFEIFASPDWRGTDGWIKFNVPLYYSSSLIKGIELEFKKGKVVKAKARKNEELLKEMVSAPNANKIEEFSLTDKRLSRITKFMANTLYDENMGGEHGNTHIALGAAYKDGLNGNSKKMTSEDWKSLGFNESSVHTDIFSTAPRTVTAYLSDGGEKVIYKNGMFKV